MEHPVHNRCFVRITLNAYPQQLRHARYVRASADPQRRMGLPAQPELFEGKRALDLINAEMLHVSNCHCTGAYDFLLHQRYVVACCIHVRRRGIRHFSLIAAPKHCERCGPDVSHAIAGQH